MSVDEMVFRGAAMQALDRLIERLAARPVSVLITGETGTGKELVAHALHQRGPCARAIMKVVNCAAIPDTLIESTLFGHVKGAFTGADRDHLGVFEQARDGTVLLDEVGELSSRAQAALLRVLESRRVCPVGASREVDIHARVIAATHRNLALMCERDEFRLDLYHRLVSVTVEIPPLRERLDDIEPLAQHFLRRVAAQWDVPPPLIAGEALDLLMRHRWPGNVRELRNVIERAVALAEDDLITASELPAGLGEQRDSHPPPANDQRDFRTRVLHHERMLIQEAIRASEGNRRLAAERLRLPLRTLERKLRSLRDLS
jgi:two-component system response regulator AtoC